jgi:dipeptidase D
MDFTGKTLDFFTNVLCPTPRASYHEELIAGKLVDFAGGRGLACLRDGKNNVVVYKPGTGKYEGSSVPVVLQAPTDMVCVPATADFSRGVEAYYSGDNRLTGRSAATGEKTSLGADDGIGAAAIMAVLDSGRELAHPPLVALFTAEEECGLTGARDISMEDVVGICAGLNFGRAAFINLDDGRFGQFSVGCAGSANVTVRIPAERENFAPNGLSYFELAVGGLAGGHSGLSIHENRGNANILLCAAIRKIRLSGAEPFVLGLGRCGDAANAIPSAASACVAVPVKQVAKLREAVAETESAFKETYRASDPGVRLELRECWNPDGSAPYSGRTVSALTTLAAEIDDGPIAYSAAATGLVETSSNLGIMREEGRHIELTFMARSSIDAEREKTVAGILREAERVGAEAEAGNRSPGWAYREKSVLRDLFLDKYRELFGEEATATPVHAGLECGHFAEKFRNLGFDGTDFISCGPTITEIHSVNETLHTDTVEKFGKLLIEVLANLYS